MGNKQAQRRISARRAATFLAALGALVMSSGVALMVAATPANATAVKPSICHPVNGKGELGNGWNLISPDKASSHIDESLYPNGHYWKHESKDGLRHDMYAVDGTCPGEPVTPETCPQGTTHAGDQVPGGQTAEEYCNDEQPPAVCPAGTDNAGDAIPEGQTADQFCNDEQPPAVCPEGTDKVGQEIPEGQTAEQFCSVVVAPPSAVCPAGSTNAGQTIPAGQTEATFCTSGSVVVSPPQTESQTVVKTPKTKSTKAHAAAVTPTVVEAGLVGSSAQDLRGEQGLALMVAGMVMLVAAGGLGLRVRGAAARS